MNSPPSSLASLLSSVPNYQGAQPTEEGGDAMIMTYLRDTYDSVADDSSAQNRYLHASPSYRYSHSGHDSTVPAPPSPPDLNVAIPSTLADIAAPFSRVTEAPFIPALPLAIGIEEAFTDTLDRGEMGGKRRKPLHARAGWKEMDDDKRGEKRRRDDADVALHGGEVEETITTPQAEGSSNGATGVDGAASEAAATLMGFEEQHTQDESNVQLKTAGGKRAARSREERAIQNRKAQQTFRRKREEKIKQLELDSLMLGSTRQRLQAAEQALQDMGLELEAKTIEAQGLRRALNTASSASETSFVKSDGQLIISPTDLEARDASKATATDLNAACDALAAASRQLAKLNRRSRDEVRAAQEASQHAQA